MGYGSGAHEGGITRLVDASWDTRHLLVKVGTDATHVNLCDENSRPVGVCSDSPDAAEERVAVHPLGAMGGTVVMVADGVYDADIDVYTADDGKVQDEPAAAGTYYKVGHSLNASAADGDTIEVDPCHPIALVVPA